MAVPTRHVGRVEPGKRFRFDNDVFENFVNRMPDMELAVGIGRSVMEDKGRSTLPCFTHLPIQIHLRPSFESLGLALRQIGLHRKVCLGQIQRGFVIAHTLSVFRKPCRGIGLVRRDTCFQRIE